MPGPVVISTGNIAFFYKNHKRKSYAEQARYLKINVDTLKRILVREGLQEFEGAKYQLPRGHDIKTWERPCLICGDKTPRPKWRFHCVQCRKTLGYEEDE